MTTIKNISPLGFPWATKDPFIFCVHHADAYPKGNDQLGPDASLKGRSIGNDFTLKDGWRMYHGEKTPGFPAHPHKGFETVTIVLEGLVDHSDSLGAAARFGNGDVQWMTAGKGVMHAEMFPLLNKEAGNPLELFQIWLNLPKAKKHAPPYFSMLWNETIPMIPYKDANGKTTLVKLVAGKLNEHQAPAPPPDSWAFDSAHDLSILSIRMEANAEWTLPAASAEANRMLYFFKGTSIEIENKTIQPYNSIELKADATVVIKNKGEEAHLLLLQGKPINEPVVQYGPFVMNTNSEIQVAMQEYQRTQFGGWPWETYENVHAANKGRFAIHADGKVETK